MWPSEAVAGSHYTNWIIKLAFDGVEMQCAKVSIYLLVGPAIT